MSPARRPNGSRTGGKIARQRTIRSTFPTERSAKVPGVSAGKTRDFDPHAFLATIGEGRKFVLFPKKQKIFST
jgi:hypothetical protein